MAQLGEMLENVFIGPEQYTPPSKKEKLVANYQKRYQLLDYDDVTKLSDVMETTVPVDGKGNFPSLEVTPSVLVQMVRDGLAKEGIRVPNVRLNGSAATHVLSGDGKHQYKDLDLIFAVDLSEYNDYCTCGFGITDFNNNINNNTYCRTKGHKLNSKRHPVQQTNPVKTAGKVHQESSLSRVQSPTEDYNNDADENLDSEIPEAKTSESNDSTPCSTSPPTVLDKAEFDVDLEDCADKDSGYTSSGSSVASLPVSPAGSWGFQHPIRSRTHSLDSSSSITSSSSGQQTLRHKDTGHYLDVHARNNNANNKRMFSKRHSHHQDFCSGSKDICWQKIKDVVMGILRDLLPTGVARTRMTDAVLADAYVQKMVKITNDVDRWSLFSLNNNAGRNLELKFVENMRRQYEFSVDSFQIILDSYQRFKIVSKSLEDTEEIQLSPHFYPSVLAESVYGDFEAALRHLRHRRICTKRPEEIRGGGLLRYCNLLVRDFTPGEVEGHEDDVIEDDRTTSSCQPPLSTQKSLVVSKSYSTSRAEDVHRLEQLMCSRFFIDFSEFPRQQQKLLSYVESHFACEEDLKFQYLLIVRRVVDKSTICLMSNERTIIIDFITKLARETLAKNVTCGNQPITCHSNQSQLPPQCYQPNMSGLSYVSYENHRPSHGTPFQPMQTNAMFQYQNQQPGYQNTPWGINTNNCNSNNYYSQYAAPTVPPQQPNYAPPNFYPQPPRNFDSNCHPQYENYQIRQQPTQVPLALCPCCRSTYPQAPDAPPLCCENSSNPQVVITPPRHTMSVNSLPFYPASKAPPMPPNYAHISAAPLNAPTREPVYLKENAKLFYSAAPISNQQRSNNVETTSHSVENRTKLVESGISTHSEITDS